VVDGDDHYIGIVTPAAVFDESVAPDTPVETLARVRDHWLAPQMHIGEVMARFDQAESDELVILDPDGRILGILTESFVRRRYADELEKAQRDLFGER
jgi:CIC family chloride channel protein